MGTFGMTFFELFNSFPSNTEKRRKKSIKLKISTEIRSQKIITYYFFLNTMYMISTRKTISITIIIIYLHIIVFLLILNESFYEKKLLL
jgi:hypothetical protein